MLAPELYLQLAARRPAHLVKGPVAVTDAEVGTPPIQDRIQLPDDRHDEPATGNRSRYLTHSLPNIAARPFARPHRQHPTRSFQKLEAQKGEAIFKRCMSALFLVHHQMKLRKLTLQPPPRLPRL
jgi:hypothetical protein